MFKCIVCGIEKDSIMRLVEHQKLLDHRIDEKKARAFKRPPLKGSAPKNDQ